MRKINLNEKLFIYYLSKTEVFCGKEKEAVKKWPKMATKVIKGLDLPLDRTQ